MAFWSRLPDLIGRIGHVLRSIFFAAQLWWRMLWLLKDLELGISFNKAVLPILWRLVDLAFIRGARQSLAMLRVGFSRWKFGAFCISGEAFFNKRFIALLCCWSLLLLLFLLAGRGGEEKGEFVGLFFSDGGALGSSGTATTWSSSSVVRIWLLTFDAGGQQLQGLMPALRQVICNLLRRPFHSRMAEFILSTAPSGLVPGVGADGRRLRLKIFGGGGGPDCVLLCTFRVCSVEVKDPFLLSLFATFLLVICTAPRLI